MSEEQTYAEDAGETVVHARAEVTIQLQGTIDSVEAEVRHMARKAGVPDDRYDEARIAFARMLIPHSGREVRPHRISHWKLWWKGFSSGLQVGTKR